MTYRTKVVNEGLKIKDKIIVQQEKWKNEQNKKQTAGKNGDKRCKWILALSA